MNSWHFYIDDHEKARRHIEEVVAQTKPGSGFNYCPGVAQIEPAADQLGIRRGLCRRRRPRHLVGPARPDHPAAPAAQDPRIRLHRADRHRVGAQRAGQLRPHSQGIRVRHVAARHAAQRALGCRLHRLRRAAGDRRQARARRSPSRSSSATSPSDRIGRSCAGGSAATIRAPTFARWSSRRASRSRGALTTSSSWNRSRSLCRTIRSSARSI